MGLHQVELLKLFDEIKTSFLVIARLFTQRNYRNAIIPAPRYNLKCGINHGTKLGELHANRHFIFMGTFHKPTYSNVRTRDSRIDSIWFNGNP